MEMTRKFTFYQHYGVEEYYVYNPRETEINGWQGGKGILEEIPDLQSWVSPRLGTRFEIAENKLQLYRPDGRPFVSFLELDSQRQVAEERARTAEERARTAEEKARTAEERARTAEERSQNTEELLEQERQRSQALLDRLQSLGVTPESL
jgi:hypothetical protein